MDSQYSGKGTAESCMAKIARGMSAEGLLRVGSPKWSIGTAIEKKKNAQTILLGHADDSLSEHVYRDLNELVPEGVQNEMDRLMPLPSQTNTEKQAAYQEMGRTLAANEADVWTDDHKAMCIKHNEDCLVSSIWRSDDSDQLRVWVAGSSCYDFSKRGKRGKDSGSSMRPWKIFIALVRVGRPHILLHEITPCKVAVALLREELGDLYAITSAQISPVDLGYPCNRPRQFSICILRGSVEYTGTWDKFYIIYARQLCSSGAALFKADPDYQSKVMHSRARSNGHHYRVGESPHIESVLSPSALGRHVKYQKLMGDHSWDDGSFFYDADQNPEYNSSGGVIPNLLSHGTLVSGSTMEVAGGLQHLAIMGEPVFPHQRVGHPYGCQFQGVLDAELLAEGCYKDIAGNSIHEPTLGTLLLFVLGHTKRAIVQAVPRALRDHAVESCEDEDLDEP